jgi:hypothetical protein
MPQITPSDMTIWGRLVKSWATGLNYLDSTDAVPTDALPPALMWTPSMSLSQFQAIIAAVNASHLPAGTLPLSVTPSGTLANVLFTQHDATNVYINLPSAAEVADADNVLLGGGIYHVRDYELALYGIAPGTPPTNPPSTPAGELELTAEFIGDYTVRNCR